jgi:hypothetical protein
MTCQLHISTHWVLAIIFATATCMADTPVTAKRSSPTQISDSITELEVQDRLNLSAEQRQKIAELGKVRDAKLAEISAQRKNDGAATWTKKQEITGQFEKKVRDELSSEQRARWSRLKQLHFASFAGPAWRLLEEEMQNELKLTDSQAAAVDELQKEFCRECERIMDATGQVEPTSGKSRWESAFMIKVREASATFAARRDTLLQKVLTPLQYDRWIEIEWQRAAEEGGPTVFLERSVIEYLSLSGAQQREIQGVVDETKRQVEKERKERHFFEATKIPAANLPKALAVLTPHQRQRWADLLGKPYHDRLSQLRNPASPPANEKKPPP